MKCLGETSMMLICTAVVEAGQLCTLHMCVQEMKDTLAEGWHDTVQHTGHRQQRMLASLLLLEQGP